MNEQEDEGVKEGGDRTASGADASGETFEARLDAGILDRAYRDQVLLRRWPFRLAIAVVVAVAVAGDLKRGAPGPVTFVGVAVLLLMAATYAFVWYRLRTNVRQTLARMDGGRIRYTIRNDSLAADSKLGRAEFPWTSVVRVEVRPSYTLVFLGPHEWITLPTGDLEPGGIDRLVERCRAASVPVRDRR